MIKAGHCGKRHNGRNVFHFSPVFPKMCWQPRMIFETLSKECFSSLIKGSFIQILFLIPRSKRGDALSILRSSAGLKWKCWSQHMCCYFFKLNDLKRKKKSLLNVLKGSVLPGPWWPKTPGRQQDRVLSPFFGILHMTSWHLLRQHDLQSHDTAWGTGRVLESSPLQMNITNIPIFQGTPDICRQEKLWALQHWVGTSTEILK